jgi:hypothetical protein
MVSWYQERREKCERGEERRGEEKLYVVSRHMTTITPHTPTPPRTPHCSWLRFAVMLPSPVVLQLVGGIYGTKTNYLHTRGNKNGELISRVPTYFSYMNIVSHRMKPESV